MKKTPTNRMHDPHLVSDRALPPETLRERLGVITESELFSMLKITHASGRQREYAGTLPPHYKVGREKFYEIDDVKAWMRRRRVDRAA